MKALFSLYEKFDCNEKLYDEFFGIKHSVIFDIYFVASKNLNLVCNDSTKRFVLNLKDYVLNDSLSKQD